MTSEEFILMKIMGTEAMIKYYQVSNSGVSDYSYLPEYIDMLIYHFQQEKRLYQQVLKDLNDQTNI